VLFDNLADGASAILSRPDIAVVQAGPNTEQILEVVGECLGALDVTAVAGGHGCVLVSEALADRGADTAGTACHESYSASELFAASTQWSVLLFGVQAGHDTSPFLVVDWGAGNSNYTTIRSSR
jgi:hypothetical protein